MPHLSEQKYEWIPATFFIVHTFSKLYECVKNFHCVRTVGIYQGKIQEQGPIYSQVEGIIIFLKNKKPIIMAEACSPSSSTGRGKKITWAQGSKEPEQHTHSS
jgi:hypothetical protein